MKKKTRDPTRRRKRTPIPTRYLAGVARGVEATGDRKTGKVNVTYVSQGSCSDACPLKFNGCYAENGHVGIITRRLNAAGCGHTPEEYALAEAAEIDAMRPDRDLRPHVVGDCRTEGAARILAAAAGRYIERARRVVLEEPKVWLYSHSWMLVPRDAWGPISVLASCESVEQVHEAHARGYAAALLVAEYDDERAYPHDGFTLVPCVYQTRGVQCVDCRLCMDADGLWETNRVIGFKAHGSRRNTILRTLEVL